MQIGHKDNGVSLPVLASLILSVCSLHADDAGDRLIARYLNESVRKDAILAMQVTYTEPGRERLNLEFTWMRKSKQGLVSHLIRMDAPEAEKGKLLLVQERSSGGADYLAYRPNSILKKKVRITGAREYKFGRLSISVQELIGGELGIYTHTARGPQRVNGTECHAIENRLRPGFDNLSRYPRTLIYLRADNGMPLRWELYGKSGRIEKIISIEDLRNIEGIWTIARARVEEPRKKSVLVMTLKAADYHPELPDSIFTEAYLKQHSQ